MVHVPSTGATPLIYPPTILAHVSHEQCGRGKGGGLRQMICVAANFDPPFWGENVPYRRRKVEMAWGALQHQLQRLEPSSHLAHPVEIFPGVLP